MINTNFNNTYKNTYSSKDNIVKKDRVGFGKIFAIKYKVDGEYVNLNSLNNNSNCIDYYFNMDRKSLLEILKPHNNLFEGELSIRKALSDVADDYIPDEKYFSEFDKVIKELNYSYFDYFNNKIKEIVNEKLNYKEYSSNVDTLCIDSSNKKWLFMTGEENFITQAMFNIRNNINKLWGAKFNNNDILNVDTCNKVFEETGIALKKIVNDEKSWVKGKEVLVIEGERDPVHTNVVRFKKISFETNNNIREELSI